MHAEEMYILNFHKSAIARKCGDYLAGFLGGVAANQKLPDQELASLVVELRTFVSLFDDPDAKDLLEDIGLFSDDENELLEAISQVALLRKMTPETELHTMNQFWGFCAGIICDGSICIDEANALLEQARSVNSASNDHAITSLIRTLEAALVDGIWTTEEEADVSDWLTIRVGDSASDTGIAHFGRGPTQYANVESAHGLPFQNKKFVLTGSFRLGPRRVMNDLIRKCGGQPRQSISSATDYLVIGYEGSVAWKGAFHGNKVEDAIQLAAKRPALKILTEETFYQMFPDNLDPQINSTHLAKSHQ